MSYLVIILFALNGQMQSLYLGEELSESKCVQHGQEIGPKVLPGIKEAIILCVKKEQA